MGYKNGLSFTKDGETVLLQELSEELFCLMKNADGVFKVISEPSKKWQYAKEELPLLLEGWQPIQSMILLQQALPSTVSVSEGKVEPKAKKPKK